VRCSLEIRGSNLYRHRNNAVNEAGQRRVISGIIRPFVALSNELMMMMMMMTTTTTTMIHAVT